MVRNFCVIFLFLYSLNSFAESIKLNICADDIAQFPNIFLNNEKIEGVEIDILKTALINLKEKVNIELKIELMPWARCIYLAEKGEIDAVMSASFNDERAVFMDFPYDAGAKELKPCASHYKISCYSYVVVTLKSKKFEYEGSIKDLPKPVRVSRAYSIVPGLEKVLQSDLELSKSDFINVKKLIRDQQGSVIVYSPFLTDIKKYKEIYNKLKISKQRYVLKSYFLAFSKKSTFPNNEKLLIWKEIGNISNNKKIMNKFLEKYPSN